MLAASNPATAITDGPLFAVLLFLSMVERLMAITSELAIERDWVTQLSGREARALLLLGYSSKVCESEREVN